MTAQVTYQDGQLVSLTLTRNSAVNITLLGFDQRKEISAYESMGDAIVYVLDGIATIAIGEWHIP